MFSYKNNILHWKEHSLSDLHNRVKAKLQNDYQYQGAYWLYNEEILKQRIQALQKNLAGSKFFYSVKSQPNISILKYILPENDFGVDVVSGGEIYRALSAGFSANRMVFAGVGKTDSEIEMAIDLEIKSIHVESISELLRIDLIAKRKEAEVNVTLRLNPDIEVDTHKHIATGKEENKFGMNENEISSALEIIKNSQQIRLVGLQAHIGSQLFDSEPYLKTAHYLIEKIQICQRGLLNPIEYISLGGGFGVDYTQTASLGDPFDLSTLHTKIQSMLDSKIELHFEPGRYLSAPMGILMSQVLYLKPRRNRTIAIVNAAMNDLIRPTLYEAFHPILPIDNRRKEAVYDVVGPVCESGDMFAQGRSIPALEEREWIAIAYAGAYGSSMSSNYNSRALLPEVILVDDRIEVIRKPQTLEQLLFFERVSG